MPARFLLIAALIAAWLAADVAIRPASAASLHVTARAVPVVGTAVCPLPAVPPLSPTILPCV